MQETESLTRQNWQKQVQRQVWISQATPAFVHLGWKSPGKWLFAAVLNFFFSGVLLNQTILSQKKQRSCKDTMQSSSNQVPVHAGEGAGAMGKKILRLVLIKWCLGRYPNLKEVVHSSGCIWATWHLVSWPFVTTVPWLVDHMHFLCGEEKPDQSLPAAQPRYLQEQETSGDKGGRAWLLTVNSSCWPGPYQTILVLFSIALNRVNSPWVTKCYTKIQIGWIYYTSLV